MANKKNTQKTPHNVEDILKAIGGISIIVLIIGGFVYGFIHDRSQNKKYGELKYEFVITDKYDDLGSNWHLIGGRATEQEYHIVYKYRLTNRPDRDDNMKWYASETTVSGSRYRNLQVGQTLYNNYSFFPY
jgi:hypothetical protein